MGDLIIIGVSAFVAWMFWPGKTAGAKPLIVQVTPKGKTPAEVLAPLVADTPTPGRFYQIRGSSPNAGGDSGFLAQALNAVAAGQGGRSALRLEYLDAMTNGWNQQLYSRNHPTDSWPPPYNFRGINIGPAWLPRNANAVTNIASGNIPQRTIALDGTKLGAFQASSYGLLWLPDIDRDALDAGAVVVVQRADGSDPYFPPKELMDLLS